MEAQKSTLLDAITRYDEAEVVRMLGTGELILTGNFKGHETEVAQQWAQTD